MTPSSSWATNWYPAPLCTPEMSFLRKNSTSTQSGTVFIMKIGCGFSNESPQIFRGVLSWQVGLSEKNHSRRSEKRGMDSLPKATWSCLTIAKKNTHVDMSVRWHVVLSAHVMFDLQLWPSPFIFFLQINMSDIRGRRRQGTTSSGDDVVRGQHRQGTTSSRDDVLRGTRVPMINNALALLLISCAFSWTFWQDYFRSTHGNIHIFLFLFFRI
jgi:hypothetical protein